MSEKIYLHLLILCVVLCQGIIATLSDQDTRESSNFLARKKRVINHTTSGSVILRIEDANYVVKIQEDNRGKCVGVILSRYIVLTVAFCIRYDLAAYKVLSGSPYSFRSHAHTVTSKVAHFGNLPHHELDGIALITVEPPFEFDAKTGSIHLYSGLIPAGTYVNVFGWGCIYPPQPGPQTRKLNAIFLPIMNHGVCHNIYQGLFDISEKHICTYDPHQYCAHGDAGAPLVLHNRLVGIHIWKGELEHRRNPDVYIDLMRDDYRNWIREYTLLQ